MSGRGWGAVGAVLAGLAVVLGAFAAHGLNDRFTVQYAGQTRVVGGVETPAAVKYLADFKTGAEYQMYHALALVALGLVARHERSRLLNAAGWSFLGGIALFSGSLYLLTTTGQRWMGAITPFGGLLFILGWGLLAAQLARGPRAAEAQ